MHDGPPKQNGKHLLNAKRGQTWHCKQQKSCRVWAVGLCCVWVFFRCLSLNVSFFWVRRRRCCCLSWYGIHLCFIFTLFSPLSGHVFFFFVFVVGSAYTEISVSFPYRDRFACLFAYGMFAQMSSILLATNKGSNIGQNLREKKYAPTVSCENVQFHSGTHRPLNLFAIFFLVRFVSTLVSIPADIAVVPGTTTICYCMRSSYIYGTLRIENVNEDFFFGPVSACRPSNDGHISSSDHNITIS